MLENAKLYDKDFDASAKKSWAPTTVINGTTYATGLFWQPLQNKDEPYAEIEETAENVLESADLFAFKPGKIVQFGVCVSGDGYKKGLPSLAAAVATSTGDKSSFVGVFKVDNGWWYCCIRNDIILSDGDVLFLKEEDAKEQFMSMLTVPDWGRKVAPASWKIEETQELSLAGIVSGGVRSKLQKVKALRGPKLYALILVSALIGFWLLSSFVTDILFAPKKKPMIVAPVRPKLADIKPDEPIVMPWETIKNPELIMLNCYHDVMRMIKIMPPGWSIGGLSCNESGTTVSWSRKVGRIAWIDKSLNESGVEFAARSVSAGGDTLVANTVYEVDTIKSPPTYSIVDLKNTINDLFQSLDLKISLSDKTMTLTPPPSNSGQPRPPINYKMVQFTFSSEQNPLVWKDLLTKFSGLTITNIRYDSQSAIWHYEGAIYVL